MRMLFCVGGVLLFCALRAAAHGGGGFRDPGSVPPPPGPPSPPTIACDCARPECAACSDSRLTPASPLMLPGACYLQTTAERWDDFATVALEFTFQRCISPVPLEAHLTFDVGPLFAATGGEIQVDGATLCASIAPSREARRKYLWARANAIDPLLLLRLGPGRHLLRAYPVRIDGATIVTLNGVVLAAPRKRVGTRLYRTGDRILAVRDLRRGAGAEPGEFHDSDHARALLFLDIAAARTRFGEAVAHACDVAWVPAVECAATGSGTAAASDDVALVALPADAVMPPEPSEPPPPPPEGLGAVSASAE